MLIKRWANSAVDAPVAHLVGVGQGAARDPTANAEVIQLRYLRAQTGFDIAQALSERELGKGHAQILVETRETLDLVLAVVLGHATTECGQGQMLCDLCENELVENVDSWRNAIRDAKIAEKYGVKVTAVEQRPWRMRDFVLFDPSGVLWRIAENTD